MSRQKVPDDKRQRTAQACDYCKRRKQKCNGMKPCSTCVKKSVSCVYTTVGSVRSADDTSASSPKRRNIDRSTNPIGAALLSPKIEGETKPRVSGSRKKDMAIELETSFLQNPHPAPHEEPPTFASPSEERYGNRRFYLAADTAFEEQTRTSTTSGQDEEAVFNPTSRLLQDQTGRLLYIGDSATLSYLHLLRRMVSSISGDSLFTNDPRKGNIFENVVSLPPSVQPPCMLADRQTADVLVESFFTNTSGLVEIFDRRDFFFELDKCYAHPLAAKSQFLCLLFLTFAIGLVMATPDPGSPEEVIVSRLVEQPFNQAELFFRSAKCLGDPLSGLEDADFWSVQALLLMSIYMLAVSKRNAAFVYLGMAVRSAIALGLHRQETMTYFNEADVRARCNIWKSLYVLDRFISASLGRPPAINEDECTDAALADSFQSRVAPIHYPHPQSEVGSRSGSSNDTTARVRPRSEVHMIGVNAAVHNSRIMGVILRKLYARRRVSTRATREIVQQCRVWTAERHECLRWQQAAEVPSLVSSTWSASSAPVETASSAEASAAAATLAEASTQPVASAVAAATSGPHVTSPTWQPRLSRTHSITILHVNLLYCHSVILLTRPFFLFLIQAGRHDVGRVPQNRTFSEICVRASYHTITMVQSAHRAKYLPRRNPFVMYLLFTAALLIMSNEFVALFHNPAYKASIDKAILIMEYFAQSDPQSDRLLWIMRAFQEVVVKHAANESSGGSARKFRYPYQAAIVGSSSSPSVPVNNADPIETFFPPSLTTTRSEHGPSGGSGDSSRFHDATLRNKPAVNRGGEMGGGSRIAFHTAARLNSNGQILYPNSGFSHRPNSSQPLQGFMSLTQTTDTIPSNIVLPASNTERTFGEDGHRGGSGRSYSGDSSDSSRPLGSRNALLRMSTAPSVSVLAAVPGESQHVIQEQYPLVLPPPFPVQTVSEAQPDLPLFHAGGSSTSPSACRVIDSKHGDAVADGDGSDSIGTDGEGFEFDFLWDWSSTGLHADGTMGAVTAEEASGSVGTTGAVPTVMITPHTAPTILPVDVVGAVPSPHVPPRADPRGLHSYHTAPNSSVPPYMVASGVSVGVGVGVGIDMGIGVGNGRSIGKQDPPATSPLPSIYPSYMPLSSGGDDMAMSGNGMMPPPIKAHLYPTADFA